jgi:(1->4)-alpha-D-glucan 1-alpha-D-glucosylmutase
MRPGTPAQRITATYRLQLRPDALTFADAAAIADYLEQLGVSHLYLSPILTPMRGSTHGYDVADPTTVSATLGGPTGFRALSDELRHRGMGIIVDIVPNHIGVADPRQNPWWWQVLERGPESEFNRWFDIDWSADNGADGHLALPVLNGELDPVALGVDRSGPVPVLALGELRFPIAPGTDRGTAVAVYERQHYRLVSWRSGVSTYRRFFGVSELAGLRQENPAVFDATHRELAAWCKHDLIDGVRVDHPDGLAYPGEYLAKLRDLIGPHRLLLIEKVLGHDETLDPTLPIDGTTGYEALAQLGGVLVDQHGETELTELTQRYTGIPGDRRWLDEAAMTAKRTVAASLLAPEVRRLVAAIRRDTHPTAFGDVDTSTLTAAAVELLAAMPVYRADYPSLSGLINRVAAGLEHQDPKLARPFAAIVSALSAQREAAVRFHQVCGALTAKAVEDTVFYRCSRLVSLQEVGGDPGRFGRTVNEFHLGNAERAQRTPSAMTTLSTHDTKRGEDVRARISVLSQVAARWADSVAAWHELTPPPDGQTGLFLLQNMFGVWPADGTPVAAVVGLRGRIHAFAEKALREAGIRTTWDSPDARFEKSVHNWIDAVVDGRVGTGLTDLVAELAPHGWSDSLAQKLLQLCGPGIPDIYQGTELWEDSLVDPDNRRPVDFGVRARTLRALNSAPRLDSSGAAKIWVTAHSLYLRRERRECFVGGAYLPLYAYGEQADHVVAFARGAGVERPEVIAAATRHSARLRASESGWTDTALDLPEGRWTDRLTNNSFAGRVRLASLFADLPVALLARS